MLQFGKHYPTENWQCIIFLLINHSHVLLSIFFLCGGGGAVLGLRCYAWAFSSCGERGLLFVVCGLLTVVASLVEHRL